MNEFVTDYIKLFLLHYYLQLPYWVSKRDIQRLCHIQWRIDMPELFLDTCVFRNQLKY